MKKVIMLGLVLAVMFSFCGIQSANAESEKANNTIIKESIKKYKAKNYVGCISDLKNYTEADETNPVAWYYLGAAYMKISMQQEAFAAFDKVIEINTVPKLTSYSIQAELCMQDPSVPCVYKEYTKEEIQQLKADPAGFLQAYEESKKQEEVVKSPEVQDIEKLIQGGYGNVHPKAAQFINDEIFKVRQVQQNH